MTASRFTKGLLAGLATVAVIGTAIAQGTPPNPNVTNPPVGAGQQSSQNTPMGTTGVQGAAAGSASTTTGSTSPSTGSSATTMGASSGTPATGTPRTQRADRN